MSRYSQRTKKLSSAMKHVDATTILLVAEQRLSDLEEDNFMSKNRM